MSDSKTSVKFNLSGSFCTLLTILFIGLKLTNYITWSWIWILSPLWIPVSFCILILCVIGLICWSEDKKEKNE
ncbi:MAG: hypothetical protein AABY32_01480 [Nanoarchaeota archaeon]